MNNNSNTIQATWLGIGSFVSFGFSIISAAILSRYLSKTDYGTYRQVLYVYNTLLIVFTLGLPRAYSYFLARVNLEEGYSVVRKINLMFLLLGTVFSAVLFVFSSVIADVLKNPELGVNLQYFSLTPILMLPLMGLESVMATYKRAHLSALFVILTRTFMLLCIVLPVLMFKADVRTAIIGFVVSSVLCCVVGLFIERIPFRNSEKLPTSITVKNILNFSLPLLTASIWGLIIGSASQFYISHYFGTEVFAEFSNGFMELPFAGMIISAAAAILLPVFSKMTYENVNVGELLGIWRSVIIKSAKIIFPLSIFSCFFAQLIMQCLYGDLYSKSSIYFQIITVVNLIRIVPYAPILLALGKAREYANVHMITAITMLILGFLCVQFFPSSMGIAIISVICTLLCVCLLIRIICKSLTIQVVELFPFRYLFAIIFLSIIASLISASILFILPEMNKLFTLVIVGISTCCIYVGLCLVAKISYYDIIKPYLTVLKK